MKTKTTYYWKEITEDGLVKEPKKCGRYYNEDYVNNYGSGYESKEDAIKDLITFRKKHGWSAPGSLFLVEEYTIIEDEL